MNNILIIHNPYSGNQKNFDIPNKNVNAQIPEENIEIPIKNVDFNLEKEKIIIARKVN